MNKEEILKILRKNRNLTTQQEIDTFSLTLQKLDTIKPDIQFIEELLTIFTDNMGNDDGMRELEEYIVYKVDKSISIEALINASTKVFQEAKDWLLSLYVVLFVRKSDLHHFKTAYNKLSNKHREELQNIFDHLIKQAYYDADEIEQSLREGIRFILSNNR